MGWLSDFFGGSKSSSSSSSSSSDKSSKDTIGQVSSTGQYAGDGFEFVKNEGGYLTRTYTGVGKDNGLGTDVIAGGTSDRDTKEKIAQISLDEGSEFANSAASATDGSVLDIFRSDEDKVGSSSYAEQVGAPIAETDFSGARSFGEAFAEARDTLGPGQTFEYNGTTYSTAVVGEDPALDAALSKTKPKPKPVYYYDAFGNQYTSQQEAADADLGYEVAAAQANVDPEELLMSQTVVDKTSPAYLDIVDKDYTFNPDDFTTTNLTKPESQLEVRSLDDGTEYYVDSTGNFAGLVDTSAKDADLGVGGSSVTVTADDLATVGENRDIYTLPTTGGGSVTLTDAAREIQDQLFDLGSPVYADLRESGADLATASEKSLQASADALLGVDLVSSEPELEIRSLGPSYNNVEYYVDANGDYAGLVPKEEPAPVVEPEESFRDKVIRETMATGNFVANPDGTFTNTATNTVVEIGPSGAIKEVGSTSVSGPGRNLDADLGIGGSTSTITADQYENNEGYGVYPTTLEGGSVAVSDDSQYVDTLAETGDALSIVNAGGVNTAPPEKTVAEQLVEYLTLQDPLNKALGLDNSFLAPLGANLTEGLLKGTGVLAKGAGTVATSSPVVANPAFKQALSGVSDMNALDRLAAERNAEDLDPYSVPMTIKQEFAAVDPNAALKAGEALKDAADYVSEYATENVPGYEGKDQIYENLQRYEDVVGFGPGQVDPALLAAQGIGPGELVKMGADIGFDASTMVQKGESGLGSTIPTLLPSILSANPAAAAASAGLGYLSVSGEVGDEAATALKDMYDAGVLQQSSNWQTALDQNNGDPVKALEGMQRAARNESLKAGGALGAATNVAESMMLRSPIGLAGIPLVESGQEGPGESIALQQVLQNVTGLNVPLNYKNMIEEGTGGFAGGVGVTAGTQAAAFVPTSKTAGQPAQSTVPTSYDAEVSSASSVEAIAAEEIIEEEVARTGTVDPKIIANLKDTTGLTSEEINAMVEKATGATPLLLTPEMQVKEGALQLTEDMRVDTPLLLTPEMQVQEGAFQLTEDMRVEDAPNVPAAETPVDLSGIPSRLTLTGAESLGPTTPDLSGITSNITFQPTAADQAVTSKMDADAAAPAQQAAADQTARVMEVLQNARSQQIASSTYSNDGDIGSD
jgi:hypothetical protein